jgi:hypothetical protein
METRSRANSALRPRSGARGYLQAISTSPSIPVKAPATAEILGVPLAESRRALVLRAHHEEAAPRHPPPVQALNSDIRAWIDTWNDDPKPFVWTKTADQILDSITRYCGRIDDSRH